MLIRLLCTLFALCLLAGCGRQQDETPINAQSLETPPDTVRQNEMQYFKAALLEYRMQDSLEARARGTKNRERAHFRTWVAFWEMKDSYRDLNNRERDLVFADSSTHVEGARLDICPPVTEIMGHKIASGGTPRQNFEDFLAISFMEIDYMSAFSLEQADRDSTIVRYLRAAKRRGLGRYNLPRDFVREPIETETPSTDGTDS